MTSFALPPTRITTPRRHRHHLHKPFTCTVPTTTESVIDLAAKSLTRTISTGTKRAKLSILIPGLNPLLEETVPYSDKLLNTVAYSLTLQCDYLTSLPSLSILFKSAGTAAAAQAGLNPSSHITFTSYFRRDGTGKRASDHANIIVNPTAARGDRIMDDLESIVDEAPEATWVLLNADLGADRAAVGMRESKRRADFLAGFVDAFYFRNLFEIQRPQLIPIERGALLYEFPGPWVVFAFVGGEFKEKMEFDALPDSERITAFIRRELAAARKGRVSSGVDGEFLTVVGACAAAFAAVYAALVVGRT